MHLKIAVYLAMVNDKIDLKEEDDLKKKMKNSD